VDFLTDAGVSLSGMIGPMTIKRMDNVLLVVDDLEAVR
jgi:hypothetical protein